MHASICGINDCPDEASAKYDYLIATHELDYQRGILN
jgi:hypothetical protein